MPLLDDPTLPLPTWKNVKGAVRGLMGMVTPPDPYVEAGRMVQQARQGDYLGALETGFGAMPNTGAIKAYHGSPHSFDRFDLSKIGTGEGAQAYGHGLYFADSEDVARSYRDKLSNLDSSGYANAHLNAKNLVDKVGGDAEYAANVLRDQISNLDPDDFTALKLKDTLNFIESGKYAKPLPPAGHMYEVNINAEPEHFLDWDKPLREQAGVLDKIRQIDPNGALFSHERPGRDIYRDFGGMSRNQVRSTEELRDIGIPGIKYLDQGSRGAGEGSRNYVVFDDKLVDIVRKYGLLPLGLGGFDFSQQEQK